MISKLATVHRAFQAAECAMLLLLGALWAAGQGTFVNLDFERGVIVVDPASPYYPHQVLASKALPGWTAYTYEQPLVDILYDAIFFSSAQVGIYDTNYPSLAPVQGRYCVVLGGQMPGTLPQESAAIAQTGRVPNTAESLTFWGQVGGLQITFGGQLLPYAAIGRGPSYTIYGCDISAFASQTGELRFTTLPNTSALIDNIQFSIQPIPEPNILGLGGLGALLIGTRALSRRGLTSVANKSVQRMSAAGAGEESGVLEALIADLGRWAFASPITVDFRLKQYLMIPQCESSSRSRSRCC